MLTSPKCICQLSRVPTTSTTSALANARDLQRQGKTGFRAEGGCNDMGERVRTGGSHRCMPNHHQCKHTGLADDVHQEGAEGRCNKVWLPSIGTPTPGSVHAQRVVIRQQPPPHGSPQLRNPHTSKNLPHFHTLQRSHTARGRQAAARAPSKSLAQARPPLLPTP